MPATTRMIAISQCVARVAKIITLKSETDWGNMMHLSANAGQRMDKIEAFIKIIDKLNTSSTITSYAVSTAQRVLQYYASFSYYAPVPTIYSMVVFERSSLIPML